MREIIIALASSAVTIFITSFFSYYFNIKKEFRTQSIGYKTDILKKVYTPIIKELSTGIIPGDGYEGINDSQILAINEIIENNYELVDAELDSLLWQLKEVIYHSNGEYSYFDDNRKLLDHVLINYNLLRKSLGLPYDSNYTKKKMTRLFINWKEQQKEKRRDKRLEKLLNK
ncbi:hypothetical protein [Neobacillus niacini]|uniref:hypothetical protein n=1 Tax=Neobacillus niacini TaxID=86668 RepID=UPI0005EFCF00|nr:hypothetical protein [Neobacillus niacini]